jgi:hypothetical protein
MRRNMIKYEGFSNRTCSGIVLGEGIEATKKRIPLMHDLMDPLCKEFPKDHFPTIV